MVRNEINKNNTMALQERKHPYSL